MAQMAVSMNGVVPVVGVLIVALLSRIYIRAPIYRNS